MKFFRTRPWMREDLELQELCKHDSMYNTCRFNQNRYVDNDSWDMWLVKHRTHDRKVANLNPGRSGGRIFFSRVDFVCCLLFDVCPTPMLLQWHVKDPGHSVKSAGGRLHLNTHTPLTQWSQSGLNMPLSRHSVGTYLKMSSHATCEGTLSRSCLSLLSHFGLILAWKVELVCGS